MLDKRLKYSKKYSIGDFGGNLFIRGDNHIILELLKKSYKNKVKCIYIDPPYNNGEKYYHYKDNKNHKEWLKDISIILDKLKGYLTDDGSIWISIDDGEMHYLKIAADKIFGRNNFINTIIWQHRATRENRNIFSNNHEYILVYAKNVNKFRHSRNKITSQNDIISRYKNPDDDPRGPWQSVSAHVQSGHGVKSQFYDIVAPDGKIHKLPNGRCWMYNKEKMMDEINNNNIWFGKDGNGVPRVKKFYHYKNLLVTPESLWLSNEVGTTDLAKKQIIKLFKEKPIFDTPKPEQLIKRILEIATNEGDIVLDAYLGSGTTIAVSHKMNRRYIGIEKENRTIKYVIDRMAQVVNGEGGGISKEINWRGGYGFKYYYI